MQKLSKFRYINVNLNPRVSQALGFPPGCSRPLPRAFVASSLHQRPTALRIFNEPSIVARGTGHHRIHHHCRSFASSSLHHHDPKPTPTPEWVSLEEPVSDYRPSGYHPVCIGDIFHFKYKVINKLGWGAHSTVWLVQNQQDKSYGAMKVLIGDATNALGKVMHELNFLKRIREQNPDHPGYAYAVQLLDHFYHEGPNGKHLCMVMELLSESLGSFATHFEDNRMPHAVIRRAMRQTVLALQYLHDVCNIVHADVKPDNILFTLKCADQSALSASAPQTFSQSGPDGKPIEITRTQKKGSNRVIIPADENNPHSWENVHVKLTDLGVSIQADQTDQYATTFPYSAALRSPEICIGYPWGKPADIWSLACVTQELCGGKSMIKPNINGDLVLDIHRSVFGELPVHMILQGEYSSKYYSSDKKPLHETTFMSLEDNLGELPPTKTTEELLDLLKSMFRLDPAKRATTQELLAAPWLQLDRDHEDPQVERIRYWHEVEEPLEEYGAGGYHPVIVGDTFHNGRYIVTRKLAWGKQATVWLAKDKITNHHAALKILTSSVTDVSGSLLHELEHLQTIRDGRADHPGYPHVVKLYDHFHHKGPNGRHLCLVMELLSESLASFSQRFVNGKIPNAIIKHVARQTSLALEYIHDCNVVHAGLKTNSITFAVGDIERAILESSKTEKKYIEEETHAGTTVRRYKSMPISISLPGQINDANSWRDVQVKVSDLEQACWADRTEKHYTNLVQRPYMRAPEVCVGLRWGTPIDVWALGCIIFQLRTGQPLVPMDAKDHDILPLFHQATFGDLPSRMKENGKYRDEFFNPDGSWKETYGPTTSLRNYMFGDDELNSEQEELLELLESVFRLDPAERASLRQVREARWLQNP